MYSLCVYRFPFYVHWFPFSVYQFQFCVNWFPFSVIGFYFVSPFCVSILRIPPLCETGDVDLFFLPTYQVNDLKRSVALLSKKRCAINSLSGPQRGPRIVRILHIPMVRLPRHLMSNHKNARSN